MLGHKLLDRWADKFEVRATVRGSTQNYRQFGIYKKRNIVENIDIEDSASVENVVGRINPDVIVNAVGLIKQHRSAKNVIKTLNINSIFPHRLSELSSKFQSRLITISTDCVFRGEKGNYTEVDVTDAQDLYGKSKNLGEVSGENCLTIRTSIIGRELRTTHSLVEWFLSNRRGQVKGFVNAVYTGFPTVIFSDILADIIEHRQNLNGLYHISSDRINKFELLQLLNEFYNAEIDIEPDENLKIDRSLDSTRFRKATGFEPLNWRAMIEKMANDNHLYGN